MSESTPYWLRNACIPAALMVANQPTAQWSEATDQSSSELLKVDLEITAGVISSIAAAGMLLGTESPSIDLNHGLVFPGFVDLHTHLDKGHIWERAPNPDGTFASAITTVQADAAKHWDAEDVYRRMEFGLKCSYAHGTTAIRTHLDAFGEQGDRSFAVFKQLQAEWRDRLILQAVALVPLEYFLTDAGEKLADLVAAVDGVLGGVAYLHPNLDQQLDRIFTLAKERNLSLDFHVDETNNPDSNCLHQIALTTLKHDYGNRVVCGHCCSLAVQDPAVAAATIALVKQAEIGIVSLPMCNLYLQDRQSGRTPRWRGVTLLHELKQAGVSVALASDNCRDPFHGFGDHDVLEVFSSSVKIAHLDRPFSDWCRAVTATPANLMNLPTVGQIGVGLPADLVLFKARHYSELLSRSQHDRVVLRNGEPIDTSLPDYAELDDLLTKPST